MKYIMTFRVTLNFKLPKIVTIRSTILGKLVLIKVCLVSLLPYYYC